MGLISPEGILLDINLAALEHSGVSARNVIGRPVWQMPWWSGSKAAPEQVQALLVHALSGQRIRTELAIPAAEGTTRVIDLSLNAVRDSSGKAVMLIAEGRDITRRRGEEELRQTHHFVQAIIDHLLVARHDDFVIVVLDSEGDKRRAQALQERFRSKASFSNIRFVVVARGRPQTHERLPSSAAVNREFLKKLRGAYGRVQIAPTRLRDQACS